MRLIKAVVLLAGIGLIINFSKDIFRLLKAGERVNQAQIKLEEAESENAELKQLKEYYQSEEFLEQQARDKLNLAKEGEVVLVLPENVSDLVSERKLQEPERPPNWRQWWNLFF